MLPCANYYHQDVFAAELNTLFDPFWQFGAVTSELGEDRDFVCVDYKGKSVVLQNFHGEIRAFANICSHRFNRIQPGERGNRQLTCAYHGWTFDNTGFPRGMPRREGFTLDDRERLCLTRYDVEICGIFIFFRKQTGGLTLREYLGEFYLLLEQIGSYFGSEIDTGTISHAANWKLLVENVLECYHCSVVHQDTFGKTLGIGKTSIEQERFDGPHSSSHFPRVATGKEGRRQKALGYLDKREFAHESLFHIYVFPNLFISSTLGLSFYIGNALPLSAAETALRFRLYEPKLDLTRSQRAAQDIINQSGKDLARAVISEDREILENVQHGIGLSEKPGVIGRDEMRIAAFMQSYTHLMEGGSFRSIASINDHVGARDPA